jgi:hypothetical protein
MMHDSVCPLCGVTIPSGEAGHYQNGNTYHASCAHTVSSYNGLRNLIEDLINKGYLVDRKLSDMDNTIRRLDAHTKDLEAPVERIVERIREIAARAETGITELVKTAEECVASAEHRIQESMGFFTEPGSVMDKITG